MIENIMCYFMGHIFIKEGKPLDYCRNCGLTKEDVEKRVKKWHQYS